MPRVKSPAFPKDFIPPFLYDMVKERNISIDEKFYPTDCLADDEVHKLTKDPCLEGGVLVIHHQSSKTPDKCEIYPSSIDHSGSIKRSFKPDHFSTIDTLVIAGLGTTALGTAALARQVANYLKKPVLALISGNGLIDVFGEGLACWFYLRTANILSTTAPTMDLFWPSMGAMLSQLPWVTNPTLKSNLKKLDWMDDIFMVGISERRILDWIMDKCKGINLLVTHSKGNFILADYLHEHPNKHENTTIVTLGAPAIFPHSHKKQYQALGTWDWRGWLNCTVPFWEAHLIPGATHKVGGQDAHTLNVAQILKDAGIPASQPLDEETA